MAGSLHHIGFVVAQISTSIDGFVRLLGASWNGQVFEDPHQRVKVTFLSTSEGQPQIELVEPNGEDSPVQSFLRSKGGGLHHVCYEIADLEAELSGLRSRGALLVKRPKPAVAFEGRRIAWVLTPEKLLLELLEAGLKGGDN